MINQTIEFVKEKLAHVDIGHDWFHTERVWKMARKIQKSEGGSLCVIELAALLHHIADPKFHDGDEQLAQTISEEFLRKLNVGTEITQQVLEIIKNISFKNRYDCSVEPSIELQIVQDADRLDAIGAVGIAKTFNFDGFKNNIICDPALKPNLEMTKEEYKNSTSTTINHFYEKLLLLKDLMNTATAKKMAEHRHQFLMDFLEQFEREQHELS